MKKFILSFLFVISFILLANGQVAHASNGVPYNTFTEDSNHRLTPTQDAYIPNTILTSIGSYDLLKPEDLYIDHLNTMYIADTGHGRILEVKQGVTEPIVIGEGILNKPTGVYATDEGLIYVADYANQLAYEFDANGTLLFTFTKPNHPLFGANASFIPSKIAVDHFGNVYIVDLSNPNGIIQLGPDGQFLGYFGSNYIKPTLKTVLQFMFSTAAQKEKLYKLPIVPANLSVDLDGLINTITNDSVSGNTVQRLNISGSNVLPPYMRTYFDDLIYNLTTATNLVDMAIGPIGNIYVVNSNGFISEYDHDGNLLFVFGGKDTSKNIKGLVSTPTAIAVDSSYNLYEIDSTDNSIHIFEPTVFSNYVHKALYYYQEGLYSQSLEPWSQVLKMNAMFDLAHKGIGNAYYAEHDYKNAMINFQLANDKYDYSLSFWNIRNDWMNKNLIFIIPILFLWVIDYLILKSYLFKKLIKALKWPFKPLKKFPFFNDITYLSMFLTKPLDGLYGIKREHKTSMLSATLFYILYFVESLFAKIYTGFIFNNNELYNISLIQEAAKTLLPILLFVVANYLVSSISDGEGKFKDVYKATIYSFAPLLFFSPLVVIMSRGLTMNELFIYTSLNKVLWAWSFFILFFMIKDIHNYEVKETVKNVLITLFTMLMMVASLFIFYVLLNQVVQFISEIISEVKSRA